MKKEKRELTHLRKAMDQNNARWLDERFSDVADAVRLELRDGATSDEVQEFAHDLSGDQDWFAKKVASASRHFAAQAERRG